MPKAQGRKVPNADASWKADFLIASFEEEVFQHRLLWLALRMLKRMIVGLRNRNVKRERRKTDKFIGLPEHAADDESLYDTLLLGWPFGERNVKLRLVFSFAMLLALGVTIGCNPPPPTTSASKQAPVAAYDSIAVTPITGELTIKFQGDPEAQKELLQTVLPEELSQQIVKQQQAAGIKVISPAVMRTKQGINDFRELGRAVEAKTILVGKAIPANNSIAFQLIVAETGELLWGESFPVSEFRSGVNERRPLLQDQAYIVDTVAGQVVKKLMGDPRK